MLVGWYMIPEENFVLQAEVAFVARSKGSIMSCAFEFFEPAAVKLSNYIKTCKKKKNIKKHINTFIKHREKNIIHEVGNEWKRGIQE